MYGRGPTFFQRNKIVRIFQVVDTSVLLNLYIKIAFSVWLLWYRVGFLFSTNA